MMSKFIEFIESKGGPELLLQLKQHQPATAGEIKDAVDASPNTVTQRRTTAEELGLVKEYNRERSGLHGGADIYILTAKGHRIERAIRSLDYWEAREELREAKERLDDIEQSVIEWETEFQKKSGLDGTLFSQKTLSEFEFPGEHDYSEPLAYYFEDEDHERTEADWVYHESEMNYDPFDPRYMSDTDSE